METDEIVRFAPHGTVQIQIDDGTLHETPTPLRWEGERDLQHVVHADAEGPGRTTLRADLVATNVDSEETVRQPVEYVVD